MSIVASARLLGGRYLLLGQPRRGVTASAQRVTTSTSDVFKRTRWDWQTRALYYYDTIPEIWYAGQFYSKGLVRLKLVAEVYDAETDEWAEAPNSPASEMLDRIADPGGGRSGLLGNYGRLRFLTGEANLLVTNPNMPDERWEMVSKDELRIMPDGRTYERIRLAGQRGEVLQAAPDDESAWEQIPDQAVVYRLWHRHPRFSLLADCPMRAVLDVAEELLLMTLAVRAQVRSRIARSGMLLVPTEIDPPPPEAVPGEDPLESPFVRDLSQHMMAALANEGDASSLVPLIVRGDGEALDKMRHLKLAIDQGYPEAQLRTEAISRLANGLDMPREVLLGTADVNHWGAWQIDEQVWQSHLQPVAEELCGELTAAVLIPALVANGVDAEEAGRYRITYDASAIVNHPNRGRDAVDLYDRGELAGPALREAKGFDEENAPTDEEVKRYIGIRTGDAGLAVNGVVTENSGGGGRTDTRGPLRPQRGDAPGDNPGPPAETPGGEQARLLGAAESALQQCRRTAGSKILQRLPRAQRGAFEMIPRGQVYARLCETDGARFDARDLVRGGAEHLLATLLAWGYDEPGARVVCDLVERHAAESLHEDQAAALPLDVMLRA